ncbi:methylmalonyl-CoA mutase [Streptosporangium becharense]|uniref:methylmalonyl-CoA mutase n=1 Tax=Streptosporangium becharense TaxID=1816182 RepID=A0A7W9MJ27_9ACTN|nr:methylmalonyl-CoA mutase family protein [Streptosporangium becharense]MBB2915121.1 methylmalonyl-CoA mutase [Streptosporangium becharense]MBB5822807.1 methylmalonyl-CoA mutase [Streptosporangium becharense]
MTVPPEEPRSLPEFPPITRERWRELALGVLRKSGVETGSPEEALASTTYDGVTIAPLYDASDLPGDPGLPGAAPFVRGSRPRGGSWDVRQRHEAPDPEAVLTDLENGVTSLWLPLEPEDLPRVLERVHLELISVALDAGGRTREAAGTLFALAAARGVTALTGTLGADALGDPATAAELARRCAGEFPGLRAVVVDATPYHDAGGADAEELGCSLAVGVAALRVLTGAGLTTAEAFGQLEFRYAATADQFLTIAKLRAARRLWARVAEVCGVGEAPGVGQRQHAVTSSAMMTARDPWVNMLRTTLACFAAGTGGADAVTVQPFDTRLGLPDAFARRIARNTHALLVEEAGVARVIDPAGGSWYVERLTEELAAKAWEWFQEIERAGGMTAAPAAGLVAGRIAATWERRSAAIARRRDPITGVSEFPNLDERPLTRRPRPGGEGEGSLRAGDVRSGAGQDRDVRSGAGGVHYAQDFEALRDLADAQERRPSVFLATIGPAAAHTARASFAANLFQAGGIATVSSGASGGASGGAAVDPAGISAAFAAAGTPVACLCSSDRFYGEHAEAVAAALRKAGARKIWLAGKGEFEGVDANLYAGCDALDVLRTTFDDLGVTR